jgi:PRTRC genetic system protein E
MSKVNFFTELFPLLEEKESIELKVQRTGDELTVLLVPKIKGKTATIVLNGTAEELNDGFMDQLTIPVDKIKGLVSNAAEVKIEDVEEKEEEEEEEGEEKKQKPEGKKAAPKKAAAKKSGKAKEEAPKIEEVAETKTEEEINPEGKSTDDVEAEIEKKRIEDEEAEKLAAKQVAKENAEKEAEENARISKEITDFVLKGDNAFKACLFREAKKFYQEAHDLNQNDTAISEKLAKANKWLEQLINDGVIKEEEEVSNVNG